jgi:hypothetical protein
MTMRTYSDEEHLKSAVAIAMCRSGQLTQGEAARLGGVSRQTIRRKIKTINWDEQRAIHVSHEFDNRLSVMSRSGARYRPSPTAKQRRGILDRILREASATTNRPTDGVDDDRD